MKDLATNSLAVFQRDTLRMIKDDLELSDPITMNITRGPSFPFMF